MFHEVNKNSSHFLLQMTIRCCGLGRMKVIGIQISSFQFIRRVVHGQDCMNMEVSQVSMKV